MYTYFTFMYIQGRPLLCVSLPLRYRAQRPSSENNPAFTRTLAEQKQWKDAVRNWGNQGVYLGAFR